MADDIVTRLRCPAELCICVDAVLINCVPCNARLDAADEIERLRAEVDYLKAYIRGPRPTFLPPINPVDYNAGKRWWERTSG